MRFYVFFQFELIYLGLNRNHILFFGFKEIPTILDSQFKYSIDAFHTKPSRRLVD
jgi:hypothetical protein